MYEMIKLTLCTGASVYVMIRNICSFHRDQRPERNDRTCVTFSGTVENYTCVKESPEEIIRMIGRAYEQSLHSGQS